MAPRVPQAIIDVLNEVLCAELTAINQYFLHAEMCADWGYKKLHQFTRKESIEEMKHAEEVIERILYLKGIPNVQKLGNIKIGETVPEQFESDLALEKIAVDRLNKGIATCREAGDNGTRTLLEEILEDEEEHLDWLETQLDLIESVGVENYLAEQLKDE